MKTNRKRKGSLLKQGFITSVMADYSFEQVVDFASENGFECLEVACWPKGKAERKYAGVTHIDVSTLDSFKARIEKLQFQPWLMIRMFWMKMTNAGRKVLII